MLILFLFKFIFFLVSGIVFLSCGMLLEVDFGIVVGN